jgi:hypothetical protein
MSLPAEPTPPQRPSVRAVGFPPCGVPFAPRRGTIALRPRRSLLSELIASEMDYCEWEDEEDEDWDDDELPSDEPRPGAPTERLLQLQRSLSHSSIHSSASSGSISSSLPIDVPAPERTYFKQEAQKKQLQQYLAQRQWYKQQELQQQRRAEAEARPQQQQQQQAEPVHPQVGGAGRAAPEKKPALP